MCGRQIQRESSQSSQPVHMCWHDRVNHRGHKIEPSLFWLVNNHSYTSMQIVPTCRNKLKPLEAQLHLHRPHSLASQVGCRELTLQSILRRLMAFRAKRACCQSVAWAHWDQSTNQIEANQLAGFGRDATNVHLVFTWCSFAFNMINMLMEGIAMYFSTFFNIFQCSLHFLPCLTPLIFSFASLCQVSAAKFESMGRRALRRWRWYRCRWGVSRGFTRFHAVSRTWNMHWISMDFREAPYCCYFPENLPRLSGFRSALALRSRWGQLGLFDLVLHADQSLHHSIIVSLYQSLSMSLGLLLLQLQDDILDHAPSFTKARKQTEIYV